MSLTEGGYSVRTHRAELIPQDAINRRMAMIGNGPSAFQPRAMLVEEDIPMGPGSGAPGWPEVARMGKSAIPVALAAHGVPYAPSPAGIKGKVISVDEAAMYRDPRIGNRKARRAQRRGKPA